MPSGLASVPQAQLPSRYQDVAKIALRPRQTRAYVLALVTWHLLLTSALLSVFSLSLLTPVNMLIGCLSFGLGILPLAVARKRAFSTISRQPPALAATRASQLSATLSDPQIYALAVRYAYGFVVLAASYCILLTSKTGGWGPQIWVESHGSVYLNERFLFLLGHAAVLGAAYAIVFRSHPSLATAALPDFSSSAASDSSEPIESLKDRAVTAVKSRLLPSAAMGFIAAMASTATYAFLRVRIWRFCIMLVGARSMARRLLIPSFRVDFNFAEVGLRTTLWSMAAVCGTEIAIALLDVYLSHPLSPVCKYSKHPNRLLIDGISDPTIFFSSHAYSELARLSATDKEARVAIYRDVGLDGAAWIKIRNACLALIDEQKSFVSRRGVSVSPAAAPAGTGSTTVAAAKPPAGSSTSASTSQQTVWDMLAAGQVAPQTPSSAAATTATQPRTVAPTTAAQPTAATGSKGSSLAVLLSISSNLIRVMWRLLPADAKHVVFGPRRQQYWSEASVAMQACSIAGRDAARVSWAVAALRELLCHSLDEDPYGSVQKDIRRVLESLADLSLEMRKFGLELEQKAVGADERLAKLERDASNVGRSGAVASPSQDDLKKEKEDKKTGGGDDKDVSGGKGCEVDVAQKELVQAWRTSGASSVDMGTIAAIRGIVDTFGRFDLHLGNELEVKLSQCLGH
ncbi:hypothetical protein BCV70DRAFT_201706 [Testicularia cyperi]|uniref:Nucleoporin protein Ndc1-Nup n=1 Tax=Testicularia cyperi TaxID=1882483 RepID=A0A317XJX5_9BASI|nr:hypothetical protein BCV70DRAFT_201706 [Testicularia cyperi]